MTTTLTKFLLARIAEDGAVAREAGDSGPVTHGRRSELTQVWDRDYGPVEGSIEIDSLRVLAECEAKRQIVEHCDYDHLALSPGDPYVLQLLALPYADHPDFREEWRP